MNNIKNIPGFEFLRFNHAGALQLKDGKIINYGFIRLTNDGIVHYTGKGLWEMWKPDMTEGEKKQADELKEISKEEGGEQKLIDSSHIAVTKFEDIAAILR